jgi:hypothetical protein
MKYFLIFVCGWSLGANAAGYGLYTQVSDLVSLIGRIGW